MRNASSMSAISCGWGVVLRSCLSTRPAPLACFALNLRFKSFSHGSQEAARRVSFPRRHLQLSSGRSCGGKALCRERPIEWKRNWSSVTSFATARGAGAGPEEKQILEKELESITGENLDRIGKPEICTADELHYVAVPRTDWRLALWRYLPSKSVRRDSASVQSSNFLKK